MRCRVCDSQNLELVIDLGKQPWCNNFLTQDQIGKEPFYPLEVFFCHHCTTTQLGYTVAKEVMFGNHTYLSGITKSLSNHFREVAVEADELFLKDQKRKSVLDIGSNDGTQLKHFMDLGYEVLGVEASQTTAEIANQQGINTINDYFCLPLARKINRKFDLINAAGVFFHLEELHSVTEGIKESLEKNGVFIVQFLYMKKIIENLAFDQIYHEHLLYYNLKCIEHLLRRHDLSMFDAYLSPIHGGSIIGYIAHAGSRPQSKRLVEMRQKEDIDGANAIDTYKKFHHDIQELRRINRKFLEDKKQRGKRVWGMGAPVKGNTLLNYFDIGTDLIEYLVEKNELRDGLFSPGKHIPIILERNVKNPPDVYYGLAWNFKNEILKNNSELIRRGVEFYFPINPK